MAETFGGIKRAGVACLILAAFLLLGGCKLNARQTSAVLDEADESGESEKEGMPEKVWHDEEKNNTGLKEAGKEEETQETEERIAVESSVGNSVSVPENIPEILEAASRPKVKGIFVTGPMAGSSRMEELIGMVEETELNTLVIDVKNDEGRVVYDMQIPSVQEIGAGIRYVKDMEALVEKCREKNIYLIARIVAFKDPYMAEVKPQWCIHNSDGGMFRDKGGLAWMNPYNREVWDYVLDIAEEALRIGFQEVQFDYVRFSTDVGMENVDFGTEDGGDRQQIITDFVEYASERVHKAGGAISADVYGMVIDSQVDQRIVGQNYEEMSRFLDYISPMVYPSHYGPYNYNIPIPDAEPYRLVLAALQSSRKVLAGSPLKTVSGNEGEYTMEEIAALPPGEGIKAQVRPWLQDFTATWVKGHIPYGEEEIRAQIQAVYDAGYEEWILWNASNRYTEAGLLKEEK